MTAIDTGGRNVLADLDKRVPTSFYWSLTLLATIGGFLFGYDTANIGSALPFVPYPLNGFALATWSPARRWARRPAPSSPDRSRTGSGENPC